MTKKLLNAALMARAKASTTLAKGPFNFFAKLPDAGNGAQKKSWFNIVRSAAIADEVDVLIYDEIGFWGVNASEFVQEIAAIDAKKINLHVNSPGGSVFDGLAIYQALASHPAEIFAYIDGWAASIASVIIMAADKILIGEAAQVMIHQPWSFVMGPADDMRKEADILDSIQGAIIDVYVARTGGDRKVITDQVVAETWFKGQAAVDAGFADELVPLKLKEPAKPAARLDGDFFAAIFPNLPTDVRAELPNAPAKKPDAAEPFNFETATERQFQAWLRENGASGQRAQAITSKGFKAATESPGGTKPIDQPEADRPGVAVDRAATAAAIRLAAMTFPR